MEPDDWIVSRQSNTDDNPNRYLQKPENTTDRWLIEHPKDYRKQGRIVDVNHLAGTGYSEVSIDEDAVRTKRVFLSDDKQSAWPTPGDRVEIITNPVANGHWLCQTPRGRCKSAQPVSNPASQSALLGDKGKVVDVTAMPTTQRNMIGRIQIDVPRPVQP